ncbi:MAG: LPS translocon maturation chaperone LptM [Allosphingosinicella sp.]
MRPILINASAVASIALIALTACGQSGPLVQAPETAARPPVEAPAPAPLPPGAQRPSSEPVPGTAPAPVKR